MSSPDAEHLDLWHRRLCPINDWLVLSGDLHQIYGQAQKQVEQWKELGITDVVDVREEWTDQRLVAELAPDLRYWHLGTHDNGGDQEDAWFDAGIKAYRGAIAQPGARLLVHCHMGINRGPSMGYRLMLEAGEDPAEALAAIRRARPIAAIAYALDALNHFHRGSKTPPQTRARDLAALDIWTNEEGIDVATLLRRIRAQNA